MGDSAWTKSKLRNEYYLHNYLPDMPELNLTNPKVREELKVTHSMARPNLKKNVELVINPTAASKYMPKRPRIYVNGNPFLPDLTL